MDVYLKQGHVGAIVAVALVVVRVVDKGTVFLWDAITWGDNKYCKYCCQTLADCFKSLESE